MKKIIPCGILLILTLLNIAGACASGLTDARREQLEGAIPGALESEILALFGPPETKTADELLSAEIAEYRIEGSRTGIQTAAIYYSNGEAVALRKHLLGNGRLFMDRFVSEYANEMLASGDLHAIAGSAYDCNLYRVIEINTTGAFEYILQGSFYRRMAAIGEVPSLPPPDGRKGHAA